MYQILGKCSKCSGNVVVPLLWHGIFPPVPHCTQCGAKKKDDRKIIEME